MKRRAALAAACWHAPAALQGCAQYYYGDRAAVALVDLVASNHGAADALLSRRR